MALRIQTTLQGSTLSQMRMMKMTLPKLNLSTPLGLPDGSIRGLVALLLGGAVAIEWVLQVPVSAEQLVLTTTVVTYYFSKRSVEDAAPAPIYIPGDK